MKLSFVIPTYNEAGNIKELISLISKVCKDNSYDHEVLIIDDNSPDKTGLIVKSLAKRFKVKVFIRTAERGLGSAYKYGFSKVSPSSDLVFMMDADFSHDPRVIPNFVKAINNGYDVAQGSRKVKGGGIEASWNPFRYLISYFSSLLTLPLTGLKDPNTSFKCFKSDIIRNKKVMNRITNPGFGMLIEFLYVIKSEGYKVTEVPIIFGKRKSGESKLKFKELINSFKLYLSLYKRAILKK